MSDDIFKKHGISYNRPGYKLSANYNLAKDCMAFTVSVSTVDVNDPSKPAVIASTERRPLEFCDDGEKVAHLIYAMLNRLNKHEVQEWLRFRDDQYMRAH